MAWGLNKNQRSLAKGATNSQISLNALHWVELDLNENVVCKANNVGVAVVQCSEVPDTSKTEKAEKTMSRFIASHRNFYNTSTVTLDVCVYDELVYVCVQI